MGWGGGALSCHDAHLAHVAQLLLRGARELSNDLFSDIGFEETIVPIKESKQGCISMHVRVVKSQCVGVFSPFWNIVVREWEF